MTENVNNYVVNNHEENSSQHGPKVTITINTTSYQVHRGYQTVAYLKELGGIPQNYELDELKDGQLVPLDDNAAVTIKGNEIFKSNLKIGHSS